MEPALKDFERHWRFARGMTYDFIEGVGEEHWLFTPHPASSPLAEQFSHMAQVAGVYNSGLSTGALDWSRKKASFAGDLDKASIVTSLRNHDADLSVLLNDLTLDDLRDRRVDLHDNRVGVVEFTHVILHHEALHQGQWTMYARLGGWELPSSWQSGWGL